MRLLVKVTLPIIAMLIVATVCFVGVFYYMQNNITEKNIDEIMKQKVSEIEILLSDQKKEIEDLKKELNETYLSKARTLSFLIEKNTGMLESVNMMTELAKKMNVDEIHICDEYGVIKWGTVPDFFGFDFKTSDQTKPFLDALQDKNFELAQEAQPRGVDKALFQYIGVARADKPGIIQVGVKPERLEKELDKTNIKNISKTSSFSKNGFIFVVDKDTNIILSHIDSSIIGKKASEFDWGKQIKKDDMGYIDYTQKNVDYHAFYKSIDNMVIFASIPKSDYMDDTKSFAIYFVIFSVIVFFFCILIVCLLIRFNVTREIGKILGFLKRVSEGNLQDSINVRSSREFSELSHGINAMLENLKEVLRKSSGVTLTLKEISEKLAVTAEQSNLGAEEIANNVNTLSQTALEQADSAKKGFGLSNEILKKAEYILDNARNTVNVADMTRNLVEQGFNVIKLQNEKMEENTESFSNVSKEVDELTIKADEIDKIVNVITGISEQINLLSLNASIEAARAGEAGRGFTVVAEEIKKLADESNTSTKQISNIISEVQKQIIAVRKRAYVSIDIIKEEKQAVDKTQGAFKEISEAAYASLDQARTITNEAEIIAKRIKDITDFIKDVTRQSTMSAERTQEISATTQEQSASVEELSQIASRLVELIDELALLNERFVI